MVTGVVAQIFEFTNIPIPNNLTLHSYYLFHVYATAVGPLVNPSASVTFKNFEIRWSDGKVGMGEYKSLQVSLIPWSKFHNLVEGTRFCSGERTLTFKEEAGVPIFNVGKEQDATFPITATDKYLLIVTNCGDRSGATIAKGEVIVKQPHGYLPGHKIWTLQWWGWFTLINALICIMWVIAAARHYKALVHVQKVIAACALLAVLEAATAYVQYKEWNGTGTRSMSLMAATLFFYSLKYVFTLRMLVETAAGAGVTMGGLNPRVEVKMYVILFVFIMSQWIWKTILSFKDSMMIKPTLLLVITIPGTLLYFLIFIWVYLKFQRLLSQLQEKKLASEAVTLFINTRMVLVGTVLLATVAVLIQLADIVLSVTPWNLQWVPYDASPHLVYTLFLLALMILWWPNADSWKWGYSEQVSQEENETQGDGKVQAEQIGIAETL